ncbi:MAG: hypothetical protein JWM58_3348 [Rhizobium sp.]|nr:hypothetical protein [Rhizobium sp.]
MRKMLLLPALMLLALPASCQRENAEYISVQGKIFIFNIRLARAYYAINLNRLAATPDNSVVVAEFEDPAGGPPLVSEQKVFPKMTRIDLQSPDLNCIAADRPYKIHITLRDNGGKVLQTLDTTLKSTLDQTVMPAEPLVTGAAYDKNAGAYGKDGKIRFRQKCKAS